MELNQEELTKAINGEEPIDIPTSEPEITKIKLGNEEYSQEDLNRYVGLAKQVEETEKRYNTKLDRVWPEYGRSQQRIKELENELEQTRNSRTQTPGTQEAELEEAKKALKQLGVLTKEDLREAGIVTKDDFDNYYRSQRETEKILENASKLEKDINGSDGRPAFKTEDILLYMQETGIRDMQAAYKIKYEAQLDAWRESKLAGAKKTGFETLENNSPNRLNKEPATPRITKDNLTDMMREALEGKI